MRGILNKEFNDIPVLADENYQGFRLSWIIPRAGNSAAALR
jgi:hypothetical protein